VFSALCDERWQEEVWSTENNSSLVVAETGYNVFKILENDRERIFLQFLPEKAPCG